MSEDRNWKDMPLEVKEMIMKEMDYITRIRLRRCSKSTKKLCDAYPIYLPKVAALSFDLDENNEYVEYEGQRVLIDDKEVWQNLSQELFNKQFLPSNVRIDHFTTQWEFPNELQDAGQFIKVRTIRLGCVGIEQCQKWLDHLAPGVQNVIITNQPTEEFRNPYEYGNVTLGNHPILINAKKVYMGHIYLTDEQVMNLKATKIRARFGGTTLSGVSNLIKKWIKEDYPVGSEFELSGEANSTIEDYLKGLYYTKRTRSYDNKVEFKIRMDANKYIEMEQYRTKYTFGEVQLGRLWYFNAKVCEDRSRKRKIESEDVAKNWNDMTPKIKEMIAMRMDIFTRNRLKICSKADKRLVDSLPLHFSSMYFNDEHLDRMFKIENILGVSQQDDNKLHVFDKPPFCYEFNIKRRIQYDTENQALETLGTIFKNFATNESLKVDYVEVSVNQSDALQVGRIGMMAVVKQADTIKIVEQDINDEEILSLAARNMYIYCTTPTQRTVNQLIKKWINEDYPIYSHFEFTLPLAEKIDEMFEGLEFSNIKRLTVKMGPEKDIEVDVTKKYDEIYTNQECLMVHGKVQMAPRNDGNDIPWLDNKLKLVPVEEDFINEIFGNTNNILFV